jgi:hypothetical protein
MSIVVYAEASEGANPGHMVFGQESTAGEPCYFGYRFDLADLPPEYRSQEKWRDYLFGHAIRGVIVDETNYVKYVLKVTERTYYEKHAECDTPIESQLPPRQEWKPHAWYSFNPDDPHPEQQPCYNCVKWAIVIANGLVERFLPHVNQGRLKLILAHLEKRCPQDRS